MNTRTFTAIDFETAQGFRWSICQIGLVRVVEGTLTESFSLLVQPPGNAYWNSFTAIHGLSPADTAYAPTFDQIWTKLRPFIEGETLIAHNAPFDISCLRQTLDNYALPHPQFATACTYRIYKKGLAALCSEHEIALNHHDALSDARACAELYLKYLRKTDHRLAETSYDVNSCSSMSIPLP